MEIAVTKIAHFNIPDLHAYHSFANRYNYEDEIISIVMRLEKIVTKYRNEGYKCISLFNGDVADRGNPNDLLNNSATQIIKYALSLFDENYLNFGNHEFSYYKNNPIYKFIKEIEDTRVTEMYKHLKPTSLLGELRVVPRIEYEDFEIVFTPYGMRPVRGPKKISHLVMHDDLLSDHAHNKMVTDMPQYKIRRRYIDAGLFDYVYCGHNHRIRETWMHGETKIYNMSSLGRNNAAEVVDETRFRIIPIILSENGFFKEVVDEPITLHKREDVIDLVKLEKSQIAYQNAKDRKELKESLSASFVESPLEALTDAVELAENKLVIKMLDVLKQGRVVNYYDFK